MSTIDRWVLVSESAPPAGRVIIVRLWRDGEPRSAPAVCESYCGALRYRIPYMDPECSESYYHGHVDAWRDFPSPHPVEECPMPRVNLGGGVFTR